MWVDYRGSLSTVYNDGEISTCGWIIEVHSAQSTMMGIPTEHSCTCIPLHTPELIELSECFGVFSIPALGVHSQTGNISLSLQLPFRLHLRKPYLINIGEC